MKRFSALVMLVASCGQMYRKPGDPDPAPATQLPASEQGPTMSPPMTEPAAAPMTAAPASAKTIAQRFVDAHDRVRAKHCAPPLTWSPKLAAVAQKWADSLRDQGCKFGHSGGQYGENLAAGTAGLLDPEATVKMWYDEIAKYKFPDGGFSMETGHFTQVVWRGTKQVGCGHSTCNGNDIWVCNYDPAGNWDGQYRENVLPLGCK
jgi:pathogenesis-related protein 1